MKQTLFMLLLGSKSEGRLTEQHDIFFGIAPTIKDLIPEIIAFWPETKGKIHIDVWREIKTVEGYGITIVPKYTAKSSNEVDEKLFFINLGGYKKDEFEEYHYKVLTAALNKTEAIATSKNTTFFKHMGIKGANSHVDEKYGIDIDDMYAIEDILPPHIKTQYRIRIVKNDNLVEDVITAGYLTLDKLKK